MLLVLLIQSIITHVLGQKYSRCLTWFGCLPVNLVKRAEFCVIMTDVGFPELLEKVLNILITSLHDSKKYPACFLKFRFQLFMLNEAKAIFGNLRRVYISIKTFQKASKFWMVEIPGSLQITGWRSLSSLKLKLISKTVDPVFQFLSC